MAGLLLLASAETPSHASCGGDFDGDHIIGGGDMGVLLAGWGESNPALDLDGDGVIGGGDLGVLLGAWGQAICAPECGGDPLCDPACGGDPASACCQQAGIAYLGSAYMYCFGLAGSWPKGLTYCCGGASDSAEASTRPGQSILDLPGELLHTGECFDWPVDCLNEVCQSPSISEGDGTSRLQKGGTPQQFAVRHTHTLHGTAQALDPCFAGEACTPTSLCFDPATCSFFECQHPIQLGCGAFANISVLGGSGLMMTFVLSEPSQITLRVHGSVQCEEGEIIPRQTSVGLFQVLGLGEVIGVLPAGQHQLESLWGSSLTSGPDGCPIDFDGTCIDDVLVTMKVEPLQCLAE